MHSRLAASLPGSLGANLVLGMEREPGGQGSWAFGSLVFCLGFIAPLVPGLLNSALSEWLKLAISA